MPKPDLPPTFNLEGLFAGREHRFSIGLKRIPAAAFFRDLHAAREPAEDSGRSGGQDSLLAARREILTIKPRDYVCEPSNPADAEAVARFASTWVELRKEKSFRDIGMVWEPDFVLLTRGSGSGLEILGGCVCFPTGWSLPDKQGQQLLAAHAPVPGLNRDLANQIESMLKAMRKADCYQRTNWGLSSSQELNQHPSQGVKEIAADFEPSATWLRIEWQVLTALDETRLLFGIRIYHLSLASIRLDSRLSALLAGNLLTMSEELIRYKRLDHCRAALISYLQ